MIELFKIQTEDSRVNRCVIQIISLILWSFILILLQPAIGHATGSEQSLIEKEATKPVVDWDTETIYRRMCSTCHGIKGEGLSPTDERIDSFNVPPADLTDPLFNSREPRADWFLVIKYGGSALGLSSQMPSYGHVLTDAQISQLVEFLKTLAGKHSFPDGDLNMPRALATIKAFPEDEFLLIGRYDRSDANPDEYRQTFYYARRWASRGQFEVKVSAKIDHQAIHGDEIELGVKWNLYASSRTGWIFTLGQEGSIPLTKGESVKFVPYLNGGRLLGEWGTWQFHLKGVIPADNLREGHLEMATVVHWLPSPWPRSIVPALETVIQIPFSGEESRMYLVPQVQIGLSRRGHVRFTFGAYFPVKGTGLATRFEGFLLWEFVDGPFWEGW